MTQPSAIPVDPFPDFALVYESPVVTAVRIETGRYLTVDLDGVEISWRLDHDEQAIAVAHYIAHRALCTAEDCRVCATTRSPEPAPAEDCSEVPEQPSAAAEDSAAS